MRTSLISILLMTGSVLCAAESAEEQPLDLSGVWSGAGWGRVVIEEDSGTYTDTYGPRPGTFEFYQTGERTYRGTWRESESRHGRMWFTVLEDGQTMYGYYVADDDCKIRPGSKGAYFLTRQKKGVQQRPPANAHRPLLREAPPGREDHRPASRKPDGIRD